jgi:hypothetical protein
MKQSYLCRGIEKRYIDDMLFCILIPGDLSWELEHYQGTYHEDLRLIIRKYRQDRVLRFDRTLAIAISRSECPTPYLLWRRSSVQCSGDERLQHAWEGASHVSDPCQTYNTFDLAGDSFESVVELTYIRYISATGDEWEVRYCQNTENIAEASWPF